MLSILATALACGASAAADDGRGGMVGGAGTGATGISSNQERTADT